MGCNQCSPMPPTNEGAGPILWLDAKTFKRLLKPTYPSVLTYNAASQTAWGDGSTSAPINLRNINTLTTDQLSGDLFLIMSDSVGNLFRIPALISQLQVCPLTPGDDTVTITVAAIPNAS